MSRSVVLRSSPRCERCQFPPRWCICAGFHAVTCPLAIDVLVHSRESFRPTSTGRLINRVIPASRGHIYRYDVPLDRAAFGQPGRELWVLHPLGEPMPADTPPDRVQVLLLDGSWREAARMRADTKSWGRAVRLPMTGESRYHLRGQQGAGMFSTIEALLFLFAAFGLTEEHIQLRLQFELHVYAGLRSRGDKAAAEQFLADSPVGAAFPELLAEFDRRRPNERSIR
jgi:DTW domain-containing protein YfiP